MSKRRDGMFRMRRGWDEYGEFLKLGCPISKTLPVSVWALIEPHFRAAAQAYYELSTLPELTPVSGRVLELPIEPLGRWLLPIIEILEVGDLEPGRISELRFWNSYFNRSAVWRDGLNRSIGEVKCSVLDSIESRERSMAAVISLSAPVRVIDQFAQLLMTSWRHDYDDFSIRCNAAPGRSWIACFHRGFDGKRLAGPYLSASRGFAPRQAAPLAIQKAALYSLVRTFRECIANCRYSISGHDRLEFEEVLRSWETLKLSS